GLRNSEAIFVGRSTGRDHGAEHIILMTARRDHQTVKVQVRPRGLHVCCPHIRRWAQSLDRSRREVHELALSEISFFNFKISRSPGSTLKVGDWFPPWST